MFKWFFGRSQAFTTYVQRLQLVIGQVDALKPSEVEGSGADELNSAVVQYQGGQVDEVLKRGSQESVYVVVDEAIRVCRTNT